MSTPPVSAPSSILDSIWAGAVALSGYLIPAILAAFLGGYVVSRWKARGDYVERRLDELCDVIGKTADLTSEYWQSNQNTTSALSEAKIGAGLRRISGLRVALENLLSKQSGAELRSAEQAFFREATGGDFGVHNRVADRQRVISVQHAGAEFIVSIRTARLHDLRGWRQRR